MTSNSKLEMSMYRVSRRIEGASSNSGSGDPWPKLLPNSNHISIDDMEHKT